MPIPYFSKKNIERFVRYAMPTVQSCDISIFILLPKAVFSVNQKAAVSVIGPTGLYGGRPRRDIGAYLMMFSREDRPSEAWRQFETKCAAYSTSDDVRPKRQVCFRTSCVRKNKSGFENITQFI